MAAKGTPGESASDRLALRLAMGDSVSEAAEASGVARRTVYRRLEEPAFCEQVRTLRAAMLEATLGVLAGSSQRAARTLDGLLGPELAASAPSQNQPPAPQVPPQVRHAAAKTILETGLKLRAELELAGRLKLVEEQLKAMNAPTQPTERTESTD